MKMTNDEFLAVIQSSTQLEDPSLDLGRRLAIQAEERYRKNATYGMKPEEYMSQRRHQMAQLLTAYRKEYRGEGHHSQMWLGSRTTTSENDIRRVIGDKAGSVYYTGPMYMDYEDIQAVCHIASMIGHGTNYYEMYNWKEKIDYSRLPQIVDEMIAVKNIYCDATKNPQLKLGTEFYTETDVSKRAIERHTGMKAFDIKDHELSVEELRDRKSNVFKKTIDKFSNWLGKKLNPKDPKYDQERLGNQTIGEDGR